MTPDWFEEMGVEPIFDNIGCGGVLEGLEGWPVVIKSVIITCVQTSGR